MYPNLYYMIKDLTGWNSTPEFFKVFQTFGMFMALAFVVGGYLLYLEVRRRERDGVFRGHLEKETIGGPVNWGSAIMNGLIGALFGYKIGFIIGNWASFLDDPQALVFSGDGSMVGAIVGAIILGGLRFYDDYSKKLPSPKTIERNVFPSEKIGDLIVVAAITGLFGAKMFALIETWDQFLADPIGMFFSGSGIAYYGGLIGGTIGCVIYVKWVMKTSVFHIMDAIAPALIIAYGVGRIGCQLSGDGDWGIPNLEPVPEWWGFLPEWAWSYDFPNNVNGVGIPIEGCEGKYCNRLAQPVWPTSVYEVIMSAIIGGFLWMIRKSVKTLGLLFAIYLVFNGLERFCIEFIRVNDIYEYFGFQLSQAQIIAIFLILAGIVMAAFTLIKGDKYEATPSN